MSFVSKLNFFFSLAGFYPKILINNMRAVPAYIKNYWELKTSLRNNTDGFRVTKFYPCLTDRYDSAAVLPQHYFFQDLFVANKIFINNPPKHVDVGSRIDGFVAHVASFRKIEVIDIRKMERDIHNVNFIQADITNLDFHYNDYCDSLSCLHVIEHFGLGRYGDKIDPDGHLKGIINLHKMLKQDGSLYLSTPIGRQRIEFDAHRVFSINYLLSMFNGKFKLESFSYIDDKNILHPHVELNDNNLSNNFSCEYGCGIFELKKI